jgi:hypothetical protein
MLDDAVVCPSVGGLSAGDDGINSGGGGSEGGGVEGVNGGGGDSEGGGGPCTSVAGQRIEVVSDDPDPAGKRISCALQGATQGHSHELQEMLNMRFVCSSGAQAMPDGKALSNGTEKSCRCLLTEIPHLCM